MSFCIVTDIYGLPGIDECLVQGLKRQSKAIRFTLNELCGRPDLRGEALHRYLFVNGAIDEAADALSRKLNASYFGLGYSAGGTALWRAAAAGMSLRALYCVSSTRLRNEKPITTPNHVFYGADDEDRPSTDWLSSVPDRFTVIPNVGHEYYRASDCPAVHITQFEIATGMQSMMSKP